MEITKHTKLTGLMMAVSGIKGVSVLNGKEAMDLIRGIAIGRKSTGNLTIDQVPIGSIIGGERYAGAYKFRIGEDRDGMGVFEGGCLVVNLRHQERKGVIYGICDHLDQLFLAGRGGEVVKSGVVGVLNKMTERKGPVVIGTNLLALVSHLRVTSENKRNLY